MSGKAGSAKNVSLPSVQKGEGNSGQSSKSNVQRSKSESSHPKTFSAEKKPLGKSVSGSKKLPSSQHPEDLSGFKDLYKWVTNQQEGDMWESEEIMIKEK